ncbi:MAG: hypothetical protein OXH85_13285 [Truepera sp.]|nr:hypothetical protein [Truepera sp.]
MPTLGLETGLLFSLLLAYGEVRVGLGRQLWVGPASACQFGQGAEDRLAAEFGYCLSGLGGEAPFTPRAGCLSGASRLQSRES